MPRGRPIPVAAAVDLLDRIEAAHVPTFLFGGTLLGAVREGRILVDDWDVDVAMLAEDWEEAALDRLQDAGLLIGRVRRWGRETPWAMGTYIHEHWRGAPSLVKLERGAHHVDLHILAPSDHGVWRYWQRGPGDHTLMRTPGALLLGTRAATIERRAALVPVLADDLLTYCYGNWHDRVASADWYGSPEFRRIHAERTVTAPALVPAAAT